MDLSTTAPERDHSRQIALLNDSFRVTFVGGTVCVTAGLHLIGDEFVKAALLATREFVAFEDDNDPYHEHDFGAVEIEGPQGLLEDRLFRSDEDQGVRRPGEPGGKPAGCSLSCWPKNTRRSP